MVVVYLRKQAWKTLSHLGYSSPPKKVYSTYDNKQKKTLDLSTYGIHPNTCSALKVHPKIPHSTSEISDC